MIRLGRRLYQSAGHSPRAPPTPERRSSVAPLDVSLRSLSLRNSRKAITLPRTCAATPACAAINSAAATSNCTSAGGRFAERERTRVKRRLLAIPSGEGILDRAVHRGAPGKAVQKSFLCVSAAVRLSLCVSVFRDEIGRKNRGDFWISGRAGPDPKVQSLETLRGSGAFCHWQRSTPSKLPSGKRLPTPARPAVACRLVSPDAFWATVVESG